jgi:hypothetical protein
MQGGESIHATPQPPRIAGKASRLPAGNFGVFCRHHPAHSHCSTESARLALAGWVLTKLAVRGIIGGFVLSRQQEGNGRIRANAPSRHFNKGVRNMGKGNNSQKNDKKNMKVKKGGKKQEAKTANKK